MMVLALSLSCIVLLYCNTTTILLLAGGAISKTKFKSPMKGLAFFLSFCSVLPPPTVIVSWAIICLIVRIHANIQICNVPMVQMADRFN
jgi:hypothetical protein